jgi:hypothetical protein
MTKTYTVAGLATDKNGNTKVRYANDLNKRLKVLKRDGFTNINFIFTETPKTKEVLCGMMIGLIQYQNDRQIIIDEMKSITTKTNKQTRKQTLFTGSAEELLEAIKC